MSSAVDAETLLAASRTGDRAAIEQLLVQCRPLVNRYAQRLCASQDVDDAVQDALWILSRRLGALRAAAAMSSWLFQTVRRLCLRMRAASHEHCGIEASNEPTFDERRVAELRIDLARAIAALPENYREILLLIDVVGHSANDAAAAAGISVEAAKSRLHRARGLVRQTLATV